VGFPAWPAVVAPRDGEHTPPGGDATVLVRFLGAGSRNDYAWIALDDAVPFGERLELCDAKLSKKSLRPKYKNAVAEARALVPGCGTVAPDAMPHA
jgi:hypothetical protein